MSKTPANAEFTPLNIAVLTVSDTFGDVEPERVSGVEEEGDDGRDPGEDEGDGVGACVDDGHRDE